MRKPEHVSVYSLKVNDYGECVTDPCRASFISTSLHFWLIRIFCISVWGSDMRYLQEKWLKSLLCKIRPMLARSHCVCSDDNDLKHPSIRSTRCLKSRSQISLACFSTQSLVLGVLHNCCGDAFSQAVKYKYEPIWEMKGEIWGTPFSQGKGLHFLLQQTARPTWLDCLACDWTGTLVLGLFFWPAHRLAFDPDNTDTNWPG